MKQSRTISRSIAATLIAAAFVVVLSGCSLLDLVLGSREPFTPLPSLPTATPGFGSIPDDPTATPDPSFPRPLQAGEVAPDFSLPATDGKTYSLSQYKGKVVLLELFAPWCPHCQDDAPIINQVYEKYKDKGVQVLAVSASPWGYKLYEERDAKRTPTPISMDDLIWFRDQFKVPFPILFDKDIKVGEQYGLAFYPTLYVIDKEGNIASEPAGNFVIENGKPVSLRNEAISVDFLSREIEKALKSEGMITSNDVVVATVNGQPIYEQDYLERAEMDKNSALADPIFDPYFQTLTPYSQTQVLEVIKSDALDRLINFEVLMQQARKEGRYPDRGQQWALIEDAKKQELKGESFEEFLKKRNITEGQYNRRVIRNAVYAVMAEAHTPKTGTNEERRNAFFSWICRTRKSYDVKINIVFALALPNSPCTSDLPPELPLPGIDN